MNLKSRVVLGLGWTAGGNFLGQLVTWSITIVVMRILSPADYGLLAMAGVFVAFFSMLAAAGLGPAIIQAIEIDDSRMRQLLGLIIALNTTLFVLLFLAAPTIARFFDESGLKDIIRALSTVFVIGSLAVIPESLLGRALKFKSRAIVDLTSQVVGGIGTLVLALSGHGVWALVAGTLLSSTVRTVGLNLIAPFLRRPTLSTRGIGPLIAFGGNVTASRVLWFFYSQADMFTAGKLLGKEALGFYSVAMDLASLPIQKISTILNQVAFPAFSQIQHDRQLIALHVLKATRILSFFAFPVLWGISSVAPEVVRLLLGAKWEVAILPLQILPLIMPFRMVSNFLPSAVDAVGRPDISVKNLIAASLIMPIAFLVGSQWGIVGLSIAWVVGFPLVFIGNLSRALPVINLRVGELLRAMSWPVLAGLVMYLSVAIVGRIAAPETNIALRLVSMIFAGILVYGCLAWTTNRRGLLEILAVVRR